MNADDMRTVRAFLPDGAELGVLTAQGAWGVVAHNLKLRQEIVKLRGAKHTRVAALDKNPIEDYIQTKLSQAKKKRKAASDLSNALRILANAPTLRAPPTFPSAAASASSIGVSESTSLGVPPAQDKPACPQELSIGTGHTF